MQIAKLLSACVLSFQSYLTLYDPMMGSLILQAWILEWVAISFFILYAQIVFHCLYRSHLYSFIWVRHLDWFHILAILNNAAMNFGVCISFKISVFSFLGYMPRSRIAGLYGNFIFSVLRNLHIIFSSCCINLHLQRFPFTPFLVNICYLCFLVIAFFQA